MIGIDTSVAVPLLLETHKAHPAVMEWSRGKTLAISGHAQIETYSVLTRLPGDARVAPRDVPVLFAHRFAAPMLLSEAATAGAPERLAQLDIHGGAVYDALVAFAAIEHGVELATADRRARHTYELVGARIVLI